MATTSPLNYCGPPLTLYIHLLYTGAPPSTAPPLNLSAGDSDTDSDSDEEGKRLVAESHALYALLMQQGKKS